MNLLLVDDHTLFREGLRGLLANISPGVAIHEAASVDDAVDACRIDVRSAWCCSISG